MMNVKVKGRKRDKEEEKKREKVKDLMRSDGV
jgi:hypothetical protein